MLIPMYNAELASPGIRGSLVALQQLAITFGILISYWIGYGTNCRCLLVLVQGCQVADCRSHWRNWRGTIIGSVEDTVGTADRSCPCALCGISVSAVLASMVDAERYGHLDPLTQTLAIMMLTYIQGARTNVSPTYARSGSSLPGIPRSNTSTEACWPSVSQRKRRLQRGMAWMRSIGVSRPENTKGCSPQGRYSIDCRSVLAPSSSSSGRVSMVR